MSINYQAIIIMKLMRFTVFCTATMKGRGKKRFLRKS